MSERAKVGLFVGCVVLLALAGLVLAGVAVGSDWGTFIPDLIIGVLGAAVIGLALYALQQSSDRRRIIEGDVSAAYIRFLDAMTPLRILDMRRGDPSLLSVANTRLVQLYESVHPDEPLLARWFEAERQLGLYRALQANEATGALPEDADVDAIMAASAPFHRWVAELSHNIRFWRTGRMTPAEMIGAAERIEKKLRTEDAWRESALPWLDSSTSLSHDLSQTAPDAAESDATEPHGDSTEPHRT